jgi:outer membrane protein assembly factor BamB
MILTMLNHLKNHIQAHCIHNAEDKPLRSSSSTSLNWLMDLRPVFLSPEWLNIITDTFWQHYKSDEPLQIGGMEVASIPLITALIIDGHKRGKNVSGFIIRKQRKTTGLGQRIEGNIQQNVKTILVDDLINSGVSLEQCRLALLQENITFTDVFTVVDFEENSGIAWKAQHSIALYSLFKKKDFTLPASKETPPFTRGYGITWRFYQKGAFPFHIVPKSTPLYHNGRIYMGTDDGIMHAIHGQTGERIWQFDTKNSAKHKGIWSSPAIHNGKLYFGAYNGNVYCLDAKTGQKIWHNPACEWIGSSPLIVPQHNALYLGLEYERSRAKGSNAAFNLDNGNRLWETPQKKYQHGSAAYDHVHDTVIFGNANHDVSAYNAKTGALIWQHKTERSIKYPPAIDTNLGIVAATSFDGNIYILNSKTGERLAAIQTDDICYSTPLLTHGKLFVGSGDKHMYVIDLRTFKVILKHNHNARVFSSPRLIDDYVVYGDASGKLYHMHPESLEFHATTHLADAITNAAAHTPDGSRLYVSTHMNELFALDKINLS